MSPRAQDTILNTSWLTKKNLEMFEHAPLPSARSIRLLKIETTNKFCFSLATFSLENLPEFKAISYTWGKATCEEGDRPQIGSLDADHQIEVNGNLLKVTENLSDALRFLHQNEELGYLWIDAICIDQESIQERSSQILLMGEIFSAATQVVVWLGNDMADINAMLWLQNEFWPVVDGRSEVDGRSDQPYLDTFKLTGPEWIEKWKSVDRFFRRRRWFQRAWVLQECMLGRDVVVWNGAVTLDWTVMGLATFIAERAFGVTIRLHTSMRQLYILRMSYEDGGPNDPAMVKDQKLGFGTDTPKQHWCAYVFMFACVLRSFESSCEHDRIYATLGVAQRFDSFGAMEKIVPDYTKAYEDVFVEFSTLMLLELPALQVLSMDACDRTKRSSRLPSWCPDYRHHLTKSIIMSGTNANGHRLFSAAGLPSGKSTVISINGHILTVEGVLIDTVVDKTEMLDEMMRVGKLKPLVELCGAMPGTCTLTQQDRLEVLWRTLSLDLYEETIGSQSHPAPAKLGEYFAAWMLYGLAFEYSELPATTESADENQRQFLDQIDALHAKFASSSVHFPTGDEIVDFAKKWAVAKSNREGEPWVLTSGIPNTANQFHSKGGFGRWATGRCVYRTSQHELMGTGFGAMERGDQLWLLKGGLVPYILRPLPQGRFEFLGETYAHGIMRGEWLARQGEKDSFSPIEIL